MVFSVFNSSLDYAQPKNYFVLFLTHVYGSQMLTEMISGIQCLLCQEWSTHEGWFLWSLKQLETAHNHSCFALWKKKSRFTLIKRHKEINQLERPFRSQMNNPIFFPFSSVNERTCLDFQSCLLACFLQLSEVSSVHLFIHTRLSPLEIPPYPKNSSSKYPHTFGFPVQKTSVT